MRCSLRRDLLHRRHRGCTLGRRQRVQGRANHFGREWWLTEPDAGGIKNRIGNGRCAWHRGRLARPQRGLIGSRHVHHLDHRHFAETENRVAAPLLAGDRAGLRVGLHPLLQGAAGGLQDIAMHLMLHALRVHHQARVMADHHAFDMHLTGGLVHFHIGHPGRPGRAKARPFAVHIARIGKALPLQPLALRCLLLGLGVGPPLGALGGGLHQFTRARVGQQAQAKGHRVLACCRGQFVNVAFMGKRIRQCRHAPQPGGAQDGRHVVDGDAQIAVVIRRTRGAVAHLVGLGQRLDGACQQQRQGGRAIGGVGRLKIVAHRLAIGLQAATHLHPLRGALGLPQMLLLTRQLDAHRRAHGLGQQGGIGCHVVGAVAAIAACGLHAHHVYFDIARAHQACQVGTQHMGVLRAGPDPQLQIGRLRILPLQPQRDRTRGADGGVHLVRPHIGAFQGLLGLGQGLLDVALVHQFARRARVVAQGLRQVVHLVHARPGLPVHHQFTLGLLGVFFALGHHAHKITLHHHRADARNVGNRLGIDRFQGVADEVTVVGARIRRPHHPAMEHARHAQVVHEHGLARGFARNVDAWHAGAHHAVVLRRLDRRVQVQQQVEPLGRHLLGPGTFLSPLGPQPAARLGGGHAQGLGMDLQRRAGNCGALVGCGRGAAHQHVHLFDRHIQFFGHHLGQGGAQARAQIHMAMQGGDAAIVPHRHQHFQAFGGIAGDKTGLALDGRGRRHGRAHHAQHPLGLQNLGAGLHLLRTPGRHAAPFFCARRRCAARRTACMISMWVPQRHKLADKARRMS